MYFLTPFPLQTRNFLLLQVDTVVVIDPWSGTSGKSSVSSYPSMSLYHRSAFTLSLTHVRKKITRRPTVDSPHYYHDGADSITADESVHTRNRCAIMYWSDYVLAVSIKSGFSFCKIKKSERGIESPFTTHITLPKAVFKIERQTRAATSGALLPE
jgi:hypothetical protein